MRDLWQILDDKFPRRAGTAPTPAKFETSAPRIRDLTEVEPADLGV